MLLRHVHAPVHADAQYALQWFQSPSPGLSFHSPPAASQGTERLRSHVASPLHAGFYRQTRCKGGPRQLSDLMPLRLCVAIVTVLLAAECEGTPDPSRERLSSARHGPGRATTTTIDAWGANSLRECARCATAALLLPPLILINQARGACKFHQ